MCKWLRETRKLLEPPKSMCAQKDVAIKIALSLQKENALNFKGTENSVASLDYPQK